MKDFLFEFVETGELIFIECEDLCSAIRIKKYYFPNDTLIFQGEFTPEEAEIYGYDTY